MSEFNGFRSDETGTLSLEKRQNEKKVEWNLGLYNAIETNTNEKAFSEQKSIENLFCGGKQMVRRAVVWQVVG
jgi:hypothetical protein